MELMPSETGGVLSSYNTNSTKFLDMMRYGRSINEILKITNEKILKDNFGLSNKEVNLANSIWGKLSDRN